MNILLDTHAYLGALIDDPALSLAVRDELLDGDNRVFVSVASSWEIAIKFGLGKLALPRQPDLYLPPKRREAGFELLLIDEPEVCQVHRLPHHHRDPFDRLLVAQANCQGMIVATNDPLVAQYPVRTIW